MNRRDFLSTGAGGVVGAGAFSAAARGQATPPSFNRSTDSIRDLFPRLQNDVFLNAAAGTPLGTFAEEGLRRYMDFQQRGPGGGRRDYFEQMLSEIRRLFADLIGAKESEIGLVHCTKQGEQIVLDSIDALRQGGNIVTNDFHFSGSLHNLVGLKRAGLDVRIVRSQDWVLDPGAMNAAIDDRTAVVAVTLVSNVNGRHEAIRNLSNLAHSHGAFVYADIIQAAGIVPVDVEAMGIDFAACSGYKWLYGVHGVGFFYAREELQGTVLRDRLYPGHSRPNYRPWVAKSDPEKDDFPFRAATDARRYQPGHVSYLGYSALYEGMKFLVNFGVVNALTHSVELTKRLYSQLDPDRYRCITPDLDSSPMVSFEVEDASVLGERLRAANVVITLAGNYIRVSPAVYNTVEDIDLLSDVLNRA